MNEFIPYFIVAFENMQNIGLGYRKDKFEFKRILLNGKLIYEDRVLLTKEFRSLNYMPEFKENNIKVNLKTPLRIKQDGKIITKNLNIAKFLRGIKRHYNLIKNIDEKVDYIPKFREFTQRLKFVNLNRYSNRQRKKYEFGGVVGEFKIFDLDDEGIKLLELSKIIGAGKSTTFGLGSIEIDYI
ncbi:CRISPR system precrRNA processing endoribonuclease RAMP protein Cas6 [Campylobacter sp. FMV-PI01]|uniref:CRISPR system precrRNA processing endoribonuclease RAMP protein Cas6 n=1 Tax=Campylobacter portucalensis TaxID=2608384 RepID=A0A6L5WM34_9BACT|nr:CRISPR system precrRNA processing endoribonuclease RAMP protein Cas6 [Campylobacter portucalensis]MSN96883.1 CRISPR system precrRNA processing endoribonuclease RAMP protein Cas6 [Campylobacter portucalensis]